VFKTFWVQLGQPEKVKCRQITQERGSKHTQQLPPTDVVEAHHALAVRQVGDELGVARVVAARVDPFEKTNFETRISFSPFASNALG
jgi:hypothetical protein